MKISAQIVFVFVIVILGAIDATAQRADQGRAGGGVALLRQLDLTPDQIKHIREMNREMAPRRMAARQRLRAANRALDSSIYSDVLDEGQVAANLREYQDAQAAVSAINFETELNVRKVLTSEQLARFREMRQRFNQRREGAQRRRGARRSGSQEPEQPEPRRHPN